MAYNSAHTGAKIDAAVQLLGQIQEARDSTSQDLSKVTDLASQIKVEAAQVAGQTEAVTSKASQVSQDAAAVEQARQEVVGAAAAASEAMDSASLSASSALESQNAASISEHSAAGSQLAAGLSEQVSAESASEAKAAAEQVAIDRDAAAASAAHAAASARDAEAVVTGGTASVVPGPGLIPLADGQGKMDPQWLPESIARADSVQAATDAAKQAVDVAAEAQARSARLLGPSPEAPELRDDGTPLQIGDRYFNSVSQSELIYKASGWAANESLQAIADLRDDQNPAKGASGIGFQGGTVAEALDFSQRSLGQNNHLREVYAVLPLFFPDYMEILTQAGHNNSTGSIGPGAFTIDETAREIIVACGTSWQAFTVITIYDLDTNAYKGHFKVVHATPEGIEVLYDYGGRKLFVSPADTGNLYAYDIAGISYSGQMLNHVSSHAVGVYCQFSYRKGRWLIEEASREVGRFLGRNVHAIFDKDFKRIGSFVTDIRNTGYITSSTNEMAPYLNKRQGFCLGDGFVVCSYGGAHDGEGSSLPNQYQGTRILAMDGQRVQESLLEPLAFKSLLTSNLGFGEHYTRIENEGVRVLDNGEIVALYLYKGRFSPGSKDKDGVVILKEFSNSKDAFDYRSASVNKAQFSGLRAAAAIFPRSTDGIYNPETGEKFTSVDQICNYMMLMQQSVFGFYAPSLTIKDYDESFIGSGYYRITNVDGNTFTVEVLNPSVNPALSWSITTAGGVRSKSPLSSGVAGLLIKSSHADQVTKFNRITAGHYSNSEEPVLAIDMQSNSLANTIIIGGGSSLYNAATSVLLASAPNNVTLGGSVKWGLYDTTFRPAADNSYALGSTAFRISQVFAGTTAISSSDENLKLNITAISDEVLDAWADVDYLQYQFKDAIELKGIARIHFGVVAQRVERVFLEHRLDARDLGLLCYDEWEETEELVESWDAQYDGSGNLVREAGHRVIQPHIPAGHRYGIRYEEALVLEASLSRRTTRKLEERINALESSLSQLIKGK